MEKGRAMREPLTDREWWLVCRVQRGTLTAVIKGCEESGVPGKIVAEQMLRIASEEDPILRSLVDSLLVGYKSDAG